MSEWVNLETGEIIGEKPKAKRFLRMNVEVYSVMMRGATRNAYELAVCLMRFARTADNIVYMSNREIAEKIGFRQNAVEKAMSELQQRDVVKNVAHGRFMLNPMVGVACSNERAIRLYEFYRSIKTKWDKEVPEEDAVR